MPATPYRPPKATAHLRDVYQLRDLMQLHGYNVRELADLCGSRGSRSTIGNLHSGYRTNITPALAHRIAEVLKTPPHHLFTVETATSTVAYRTRRKVAA